MNTVTNGKFLAGAATAVAVLFLLNIVRARRAAKAAG